MGAAPHLFDNEERAEAVDVCLAAAGRSRRSHRVVHVKTRPQDWGIADAPGNFPGQAARGGYAGQVAVRVQTVTVDGPVVVLLVHQPVADHGEPGGVRGVRALLGVEVVPGIDAALPLEPHFPRARRVQIVLDLEAHVAGEGLGALPNQQVMVGDLEDLVGDVGGSPHSLDPRNPAGTPVRSVHAARVQLNHPVRVRAAAVADARVLGVEFDDVHSGNQALENVLALGHHAESAFHDDLVPAVFVAVPVPRGNHHRVRA